MVKTYLFNYENGTSKSLYDLVEFYNRIVIRLLSRDYRTPIKRS